MTQGACSKVTSLYEASLNFDSAAVTNQRKKVVADRERTVIVGRHKFQAHVIVTEVRFRDNQAVNQIVLCDYRTACLGRIITLTRFRPAARHFNPQSPATNNSERALSF